VAKSRAIPAGNSPADDFQRAAAAAEAEVGRRIWWELSFAEQTEAIYLHLRRMDAERTAAMSRGPQRRAGVRVSGPPIGRTASAEI
jgi:hypothetical protein